MPYGYCALPRWQDIDLTNDKPVLAAGAVQIVGAEMTKITNEFDALCRLAEQAYNEDQAVSFESTLIDILIFVKNNQSARNELVEEFKSLLSSGNGPFEAVAFCMHELRWPEIQDFAIARMNTSTDPRSEALRSLVLAYDDDWPDADLYAYYASAQ